MQDRISIKEAPMRPEQAYRFVRPNLPKGEKLC
jgi:hypothetical protein